VDVDLRFSQSLHTLELHRHMAPYGIDVQYSTATIALSRFLYELAHHHFHIL
jgi:hypothetical protein